MRNAWTRARQRRRWRYDELAQIMSRLSRFDRVALLCDLATSRDPGARRIAAALLRWFADLPASDWIAEHLGVRGAMPAEATRI